MNTEFMPLEPPIETPTVEDRRAFEDDDRVRAMTDGTWFNNLSAAAIVVTGVYIILILVFGPSVVSFLKGLFQ